MHRPTENTGPANAGAARKAGAAGNAARPESAPADDFTSTLRALFARELASHDPNTERIRARLQAGGLLTTEPALPPAGASATAGTSTTDDTPGTDRTVDSRSATWTPRSTSGRRDLVTKRPGGVRPRPRPAQDRGRGRLPLLAGAGAASIVGVFLLSSVLTHSSPDLGTVTVSSHPATRTPVAPTTEPPPTKGVVRPSEQLAESAAPTRTPPVPTPTTDATSPSPGEQPNGGTGATKPGTVRGTARGMAGSASGSGWGGSSGWGGGAGGGASDRQHGQQQDRDSSTGTQGRDGDDSSYHRFGDSSGTGHDRDASTRESAGSSASARVFGASERTALPAHGCLDWVLFNAGVQTRAAHPAASIDTSRLAAATAAGSFRNSFSWTGGRPLASGTGDNDRLATSRFRLSIDARSGPRRLDLYLGGPNAAFTVVVGDGRDAESHQVALGSSHGAKANGDADAVLSVWLPRAAGSTPISVTASDGSRMLTLAAAVLY
ncbi:hypothetical protein CcI49_21005 [Frankia sp. CcI49]|nr:hypothetical protein ACG83_26945 [Frankia sp. R43]ONH58683.1 hypothetical protein CcI49_21005 [Frankia sp. CcI49]